MLHVLKCRLINVTLFVADHTTPTPAAPKRKLLIEHHLYPSVQLHEVQQRSPFSRSSGVCAPFHFVKCLGQTHSWLQQGPVPQNKQQHAVTQQQPRHGNKTASQVKLVQLLDLSKPCPPLHCKAVCSRPAIPGSQDRE